MSKHVNGYLMDWVKGEGYRYQHVLAMEKKLGRKLKAGEEVNHRDGNKSNNDISNLQLVVRGKSRPGGPPSHAAIDPALQRGGRPKGS